METSYSIYTLSHPITKEVRYIGKTNQKLKYRLRQHIKEATDRKLISYKNNWIISLIDSGLIPEIESLEDTSTPNSAEIYWISQIRSWGFRLTNMTDGGDGNNNQIRSREAYIKSSAKLKGRPRPQYVREKISNSHKGKVISSITKEKLRQANLGKKLSQGTKDKLSKAVYKLNLDGDILATYKSIAKAGDDTGASKGAISNVCIGRQKTAGGFKWKYV